MAFTRGYRLYTDGARVLDWSYGEDARVVAMRELFSGHGWTAPTASLLLRAHVLHGLPPWFPEMPAGDVVLVLAGSSRGGAYYDPAPTICYRVNHAHSFSVELEQSETPERMRFYRRAIELYERACAFYGAPVAHVSHRMNDYRLSLAKLQFRTREPFAAIRTLASIGPAFFAAALLRKLSGSRASRGAG
jgi:hypothetical protein